MTNRQTLTHRACIMTVIHHTLTHGCIDPLRRKSQNLHLHHTDKHEMWQFSSECVPALTDPGPIVCVFQRDPTQSGWYHDDVFFHPYLWNLRSKNLHDRSHLAPLAEPEEAQRPFLATSSGCDGSDCQGSREAKGRCRFQLCVLLCSRLSRRSVADVPCQNGCCRWGQIYVPDRIPVKSVYSWWDTVFFVLPCVLQGCGWGFW